MPFATLTTLSSIPALSGIPEDDLRALVPVVKWHQYEPGSAIIVQNDASALVGFIISGFAKVVRGGKFEHTVAMRSDAERRRRPRNEVMVALLAPNNTVGEAAALLASKAPASVIALTPCEVIGIPQADFLACMRRHPSFALTVAQEVARRQVNADRQIELMRGDLEGRIHALNRHCRALGLDVKKWLSNAEIARMVGATRVAVSQTMSRINANGLDLPA
jgi:CRP/FNR family transcriptional regulator, cyclic AMP receptor protein